MKKLSLMFLLLFSLPALSQMTTVSATVVDSTGQVWTNGRISYVFKKNPFYNGAAQFNNAPMPLTYGIPITIPLDGTGSFTTTLPSNSAITPAGSTWTFTICPNATVISCNSIDITLTGASQDISSLLTPILNPISVGVTPIPIAYADSQIKTTPVQSGFYFNSTTKLPRYWDGSAWQSIPIYGNPGLPNTTHALIGNNVGGADATPFVIDKTTGNSNTPGTFTAQALNGIFNPLLFAGSDLGAQINSVFTAYPCAHVLIPPGSYNYATQIDKPRCGVIEGVGNGRNTAGAGQTTLFYTASTRAAIAVHDNAGNTEAAYRQGKVANLALISTGQSSTSNVTGVYWGGDPSGIISPATDTGDDDTLDHVFIAGFDYDTQVGNHSYLTTIIESPMEAGMTAEIYIPKGLVDTNENIRVFGGKLFNGSVGLLNPGGNEITFYSTSFDYNIVAFQGAYINCSFCHIEQNTFPLFIADSVSGTNIHLEGGTTLAGTIGADNSILQVPGNNLNVNFYTAGTSFYAPTHPPYMINVTVAPYLLGNAGSSITVINPPYEGGNSYTAIASAANLSIPNVFIFDPENGSQVLIGSTGNIDIMGALRSNNGSFNIRGGPTGTNLFAVQNHAGTINYFVSDSTLGITWANSGIYIDSPVHVVTGSGAKVVGTPTPSGTINVTINGVSYNLLVQ